jgi:hypothetical protein
MRDLAVLRIEVPNSLDASVYIRQDQWFTRGSQESIELRSDIAGDLPRSVNLLYTHVTIYDTKLQCIQKYLELFLPVRRLRLFDLDDFRAHGLLDLCLTHTEQADAVDRVPGQASLEDAAHLVDAQRVIE